MSDRLIGIVLLAGCGLFYWQTYSIRRPGFAAFETFDAATYPRLVLILLALFSLALVVRGAGPVRPRLTLASVRHWLERYRLPLVSLVLFGLYVFVLPYVGWTGATMGYLVVMQLILLPRRGRGAAYVLGGSVVFTIVLGQVFERLLSVVLPRPTLF